jgi:hypothetical protein
MPPVPIMPMPPSLGAADADVRGDDVPPLAILGAAGASVALTVLIDRWAKRHNATVDDYHEREFDIRRLPGSPLPPFGS